LSHPSGARTVAVGVPGTRAIVAAPTERFEADAAGTNAGRNRMNSAGKALVMTGSVATRPGGPARPVTEGRNPGTHVTANATAGSSVEGIAGVLRGNPLDCLLHTATRDHV
jgi:hypothetical protein